MIIWEEQMRFANLIMRILKVMFNNVEGASVDFCGQNFGEVNVVERNEILGSTILKFTKPGSYSRPVARRGKPQMRMNLPAKSKRER